MGLMICRWTNSEDDGIYWMGDDVTANSADGYTLFSVMERYLTHGETMEILKYSHGEGERSITMLEREREAHSVAPPEPWYTGIRI